MRFEARELESYAEPVRVNDLRVGETYFSVQFFDEEMLTPVVTPLIYLGRDLNGQHPDYFFFEDLEAYLAGVQFEKATEEERPSFQIAAENGMNHIFEFEKGLNQLLLCSLRRNKIRPR